MGRKLLALGLATAILGGTATVALADPSPNVIVGTLGNDRLFGTRAPDVIYGLLGNDRLFGGQKSDDLRGGRGNDVLRDASTSGPPSVDVFRGGGGFDRCIGNRGDLFFRCEIIRYG